MSLFKFPELPFTINYLNMGSLLFLNQKMNNTQGGIVQTDNDNFILCIRGLF